MKAALIALAAAGALSACAALPEPETGPSLAQADTQLGHRLRDTPDLAVAGAPLHAELLKHFYARHGFQPVWTERRLAAKSLAEAVEHAGDEGLDPRLFHADLLRHSAQLPPLDRDLLLSDSFLSYADALARGAVPLERRSDDQVLAPEPVDIAAAVDRAADSPNPAGAIAALAPHTPAYLALRQALRSYHASAGRKLPPDRLRTIVVNLERQRWLPRALPADRAWVNAADQRLTLYRGNRPIFSTRVVVGQDQPAHQTPEFRASIDASFFDPPWVIPSDIVAAEIQPKIDRDPAYLTRNHMILLADGQAEQLPGPDAGLGQIMFDMPNRFDVYLHDTPDRYIFKRDNRRLSHGCIRVQNPLAFAALLLDQKLETVEQGVAQTSTTRHDLPKPVPVFVVYQTAFLGADGTLQFRPDFYHRDARIFQLLQAEKNAALF